MEYFYFFAAVVLAGAVLSFLLYKKRKHIVWAYWSAFALFVLYVFLFTPYRFNRMLADLSRLFN